MLKTKTNKNLLTIIGSLVMMLLLAFVPMIVSLTSTEVHAEGASISAEVSGDQNTITVTVKGADSTPTFKTGEVKVTQGDTAQTVTTGNFTETQSGSKTYVATVTLSDPEKIGMVKIVVTVGSQELEKEVTVNITQLTWYQGTVQPIISILDKVVPILLTLVGTAGAIFIVILSVNYSKAEDASKREEARKRLIGTVIGVVLMVALLIVVFLFTKNAASIIRWIKGM